MTAPQNPVAPEHLPFFITAPGDTDVLFNVAAAVVLLSVILLGILFLTIHSLPERMAHKSKKVQFDIVAVLCLLALFTHEHVFWVAALLLAFIDIPDFSTPFRRIAAATEIIAGRKTVEPFGAESSSGPSIVEDDSVSRRSKAEHPEAPAQVQKSAVQKGAVHA